MKSCIIPGSFDPFTLGHLDIVVRASMIFDKVYVAIMVNPKKKGFLNFATRKRIAEISCAGLANVEVITADGFLVDLCAALKTRVIVKGVRNSTDYEYEKNFANANKFISPTVETLYMQSSSEYEFISSSLVRELALNGRKINGLVDSNVIKFIEAKALEK